MWLDIDMAYEGIVVPRCPLLHHLVGYSPEGKVLNQTIVIGFGWDWGVSRDILCAGRIIS